MMVCTGVLASLLLAGVGTVQAQDEQPTDDQVNAVAKGLYCPVCENVPLDVCPTPACKQWRDTIRDQLAQGWTQGQIEQFFVDQYGDRVLGTPPATGLNWLVYLLPPLVFVAGAMILAGVFRGWRKPLVSTIESASPDDRYLERVEEEIRRRG
ncbi:MAG: cytochrome c-type biogenesis protein CcmH [Chloroflexi bacterium]|nr:cytochrome c-type biogenesis protein CcmH [Chloroflexota bacterium]